MSRIKAGSLVLSAVALVSIAVSEGYRPTAYTPVKGDVNTLGYGTTTGVKPGDKTTPERALVLLLNDASDAAKAVQRCADVPLYQYEFDAYVSFTYNVGEKAFCSSTLAKKLNAGDYAGACAELRRWVNFKGRPLPGLVARREKEYRQCMGDP